jgi:hypothetical protein
MTIIASAGHTPEELGRLGDRAFADLVSIAYDYLFDEMPDVLVTGMNRGWEQALAAAAIELDIPIHVFPAYVGQADKWSPADVSRYWTLLERSTLKKAVTPGPWTEDSPRLQDEAIVRVATKIVALWDGTPGRTDDRITMAESIGLPITNLWDQWTS